VAVLWRLVLTGRGEAALAHAARPESIRTLGCGKPVTEEASKLMSGVTPDDVTCVACRKAVDLLLAHHEAARRRRRPKPPAA
jgi:hypothetical protein